MLEPRFVVVAIVMLGLAGLGWLALWVMPKLRRVHPWLPTSIGGVAATTTVGLSLWKHDYLTAIAVGAFFVLLPTTEWLKVRYPGSWINRPIGQVIAERRNAKHLRNR